MIASAPHLAGGDGLSGGEVLSNPSEGGGERTLPLGELAPLTTSIGSVSSEVDALAVFCVRLKVDPSRLLSEEFLLNADFMELISSTAAAARFYYDLVSTWQGNQRFIKKVSEVSSKHRFIEMCMDELAKTFVEIEKLNLSGSNISSDALLTMKKGEVQLILPLLRRVKKAMEDAVPGLQACIRAQKARRLSKIRAALGALDVPGFTLDSMGSSSSATDPRDKLHLDPDFELKYQVNKCRVCLETFHNRYQLIKHQNNSGHKLKRGRPSLCGDKS